MSDAPYANSFGIANVLVMIKGTNPSVISIESSLCPVLLNLELFWWNMVWCMIKFQSPLFWMKWAKWNMMNNESVGNKWANLEFEVDLESYQIPCTILRDAYRDLKQDLSWGALDSSSWCTARSWHPTPLSKAALVSGRNSLFEIFPKYSPPALRALPCNEIGIFSKKNPWLPKLINKTKMGPAVCLIMTRQF